MALHTKGMAVIRRLIRLARRKLKPEHFVMVSMENQAQEFAAVLEKVYLTGYGALYNWFAVNEAPANGGFIDGMTVPNDAEWTTLITHLGGLSVAGGKLKSTRTDPTIAPRWDDPNTGATDEVEFGALPGGYRSEFFSYGFTNISENSFIVSSTSVSATLCRPYVCYFNEQFIETGFTINKKNGFSVRTIRPATPTEQALDDGTITGTVQDYNGNYYETVKIGTQVWLAQNLRCTNYADGTPIPNVTNNTTWAGLTTGAYCWYNNDPNTPGIVYTDEVITL